MYIYIYTYAGPLAHRDEARHEAGEEDRHVAGKVVASGIEN